MIRTGATTTARARSWSHAQSYRGASPAALVHRARLRQVRSIVRGLQLAPEGRVVDLGCSDGFVVTQLRRSQVLPEGWRISGFDRNQRLVAQAASRHLPGARFTGIDLNDPSARVAEPGDLVICLETLEHVGDYRSALEVIHHAIAPGGRLVLSMPNEVGVIGLGKFLGRPLLRRRPYQGFFPDRRAVRRYLLDLCSGRDLERYRRPPRPGWAPHLGFDHRAVRRHVQERYLDTGRWTLERVHRSAFGANHFLVVRRGAD